MCKLKTIDIIVQTDCVKDDGYVIPTADINVNQKTVEEIPDSSCIPSYKCTSEMRQIDR